MSLLQRKSEPNKKNYVLYVAFSEIQHGFATFATVYGVIAMADSNSPM
jgi:hypothetical protein